MLFIHPMWSSETERLGKEKCSSIGYKLHVISELIGFIGLILLFSAIIWLICRAISSEHTFPSYWILLIPFAIGIISEIMFHYSWFLALRKDYEYDYESDTVQWIENNQKKSFKYKPDKD